MAELPLEIDSNAFRLAEHFEALPRELQQLLLEPCRQATRRMYQAVLAREPVRTGALRAATRWFVDQGRDSEGNWVRGRVRVLSESSRKPNIKARALEYGARRYRPISAHHMMLSHFWGHPVEPQDVIVGAYRRHFHLEARHFLRDAAAPARSEWRDAVRAATAAAVLK